MVRLVNGEIVPDDAPRSQVPQAQSPDGINIFPTTNGKFGRLSEFVAYFGYKSEIIWLLMLFVVGFFMNAIKMLIFAFLLWIYNRNQRVVESKHGKLNSFRTIGAH